MDIAQLAQLGVGVVSLFLLMLLWKEFQLVNAFIRQLLQEMIDDRRKAEAQRIAMMEKIGIDPTDSGIYRRADLGLPPVPPKS